MNLDEIKIYAEVVKLSNFTAAAKSLGITKQLVSRRMMALEARLGARLLNRTTRQLSTTDLGREFYHRCIRILAELAEAEQLVSNQSGELRGLLHAQGYFSDKTLDIFKTLTLVLFSFIILYFLFGFIKNQIIQSEKSYPSVFAVFLFICTALSVILQFYLLGNQYVTDRTALFFYPLLAIMMPIVAVWSFQFRKKLGVAVSIIFIVFSLNHVKRSYSFTMYREWWYDAHTYEILDFLKSEYDKSDKKQPIRFNMTWMFNPSFTYYHEKGKMTFIAPLKYDKQPDTTNVYDFYYCTRDELPALEKQYEKIKEWDSGQWILMKRRVGNSSFLK